MSIEVDKRNGMIAVNVAEHDRDGDCEGERFTPAEVRALAEEMLAAVTEAEPIFARERELCAVRREWGQPYNSRLGGEDVTIQNCQREGCQAKDIKPGSMSWISQERMHGPRGMQIRCTGPGCDGCDYAKLGEKFRSMLVKAMADLEPPVLGEAFRRVTMTVER